jgi:hypothetical protein
MGNFARGSSVVTFIAAEDRMADLLLMQVVVALFDGLAGNVKQELPRPRGALELRTCRNVFNHIPALVEAERVRFFALGVHV